mmetsp:Transcript_25371/g.63623  ORF Transcript_25371/g.63623 Transcript_25371/m.63623 type:complete len:352 (+) Transcript_25371:2198-3253(+)
MAAGSRVTRSENDGETTNTGLLELGTEAVLVGGARLLALALITVADAVHPGGVRGVGNLLHPGGEVAPEVEGRVRPEGHLDARGHTHGVLDVERGLDAGAVGQVETDAGHLGGSGGRGTRHVASEEIRQIGGCVELRLELGHGEGVAAVGGGVRAVVRLEQVGRLDVRVGVLGQLIALGHDRHTLLGGEAPHASDVVDVCGKRCRGGVRAQGAHVQATSGSVAPLRELGVQQLGSLGNGGAHHQEIARGGQVHVHDASAEQPGASGGDHRVSRGDQLSELLQAEPLAPGGRARVGTLPEERLQAVQVAVGQRDGEVEQVIGCGGVHTLPASGHILRLHELNRRTRNIERES